MVTANKLKFILDGHRIDCQIKTNPVKAELDAGLCYLHYGDATVGKPARIEIKPNGTASAVAAD
jgi:hypothetical protein